MRPRGKMDSPIVAQNGAAREGKAKLFWSILPLPPERRLQSKISLQLLECAAGPGERVWILTNRPKTAIFIPSKCDEGEGALRPPLQRAGPGASRQGRTARCHSRAGAVKGPKTLSAAPGFAPRYRGVKRRASWLMCAIWVVPRLEISAVPWNFRGAAFLSPTDTFRRICP